MLRCLFNREIGEDLPLILSRAESLRRTYTINLSNKREILCNYAASVNSLDIELAETRYMLAGLADGTVSVYDLQQFNPNPRIHSSIEPLFITPKNRSHEYGVSSVQWYTHDTGMFFSGSFDHKINVWDTNTQKVVCRFEMPSHVYGIALSPAAIHHTLIAAATGDQKLRLCDPVTGGSTHCLFGHRDAILAVKWSPSNEYILASGSVDKSIKFWDIRRSGCLLSLDHNNNKSTLDTNRAYKQKNVGSPTKPAPVSTAHEGPVTSLCFSPDGLYLYSASKDNTIHRWNTHTGLNTLVNYGGVHNASEKGNQMAISNDGELLYHPNGAHILVSEAHTGRKVGILRGHYNLINTIAYHPALQEMYSGGTDNQILCWVPSLDEQNPQDTNHEQLAEMDKGDTWSDDEDDSSSARVSMFS